MIEQTLTTTHSEPEAALIPAMSPAAALTTLLPARTSTQLLTMFRDPSVLEKEERVELIQQLRDAVALEPHIPELRVVLGMALCTNYEAQEAMNELRDAVEIEPDNFLARLKLGELLMRLRICDQAEEHTHAAARLAANSVQAELARQQAAAIRKMRLEGVERSTIGKMKKAFRVGIPFMRSKQSRAAIAVSSR